MVTESKLLYFGLLLSFSVLISACQTSRPVSAPDMSVANQAEYRIARLMLSEVNEMFAAEQADHSTSLLMALQAADYVDRMGLVDPDLLAAISGRIAAATLQNPVQRWIVSNKRLPISDDLGWDSLWARSRELQDTRVLWDNVRVALSGDRQWMAVLGFDRVLRVRHVDNEEAVAEFSSIEMQPALSESGNLLAQITGTRRFPRNNGYLTHIIALRDVSTGEVLQRRYVDLTGESRWTHFSPDDDILALGNRQEVVVFSASGNEEFLRFKPLNGEIVDIAFSPDASEVAVRTSDGNIRVWALQDHTVGVARQVFDRAGFSVVFSADGSLLFEGISQDQVRVLNGFDLSEESSISIHELRSQHSVSPQQISMRPYLSFGQTLPVWWAANYDVLDAAMEEHLNANIRAIAEDGSLYVIGDEEGVFTLFDGNTGEVVSNSTVNCGTAEWQGRIAISPAGNQIAFPNFIPRVCSLESENPIFDFKMEGTYHPYDIAFSADGRMLAAAPGSPLPVHIFDAETGTIIRTLEPETWGSQIAFSPSGRFVVGTGRGGFGLWSTASGTFLNEFFGHEENIQSLSFSPDETRIVTRSYDGTMRLWNVPDIARASLPEAAETACSYLRNLGGPMSFTIEDIERFPVLRGEPVSNETALVSPCRSHFDNDVTGVDAALTTGGGTSDARFIKDYCPVAELGLKNDTAHKVDEFTEVSELERLADIYTGILARYFG